MSAAFGEICLHAMVKIQQKRGSNNSGERGIPRVMYLSKKEQIESSALVANLALDKV